VCVCVCVCKNINSCIRHRFNSQDQLKKKALVGRASLGIAVITFQVISSQQVDSPRGWTSFGFRVDWFYPPPPGAHFAVFIATKGGLVRYKVVGLRSLYSLLSSFFIHYDEMESLVNAVWQLGYGVSHWVYWLVKGCMLGHVYPVQCCHTLEIALWWVSLWI